MHWSVPIGRVFGITLRLHVTFLLFLVVIGYAGFAAAGPAGAGWAVALFVSIFTCIALHELGHSVVAQQFGVRVRSITLLPIGGVAALKSLPENPWEEIAITLAGPLVNVGIAAAMLPLTGLPTQLFLVRFPQDLSELLLSLVTANTALFLFNLIPAFPMDGGRLLRALLALVFSHRRATIIAATVGQVLAVVFVLAGLKLSVWLIIIGVFIFIGAEGEERLVKTRSLLRELEVEEVMSREFLALAPTDTIARGLAAVYQTGQDDFPVLAAGGLLGLVNREDMVAAANEGLADQPVTAVMDPRPLCVPPRAPLVRVHEEMRAAGRTAVPVLDGERLVGLLSAENISRYLLVQASIKPARRRGGARKPALPPVIGAAPSVVVPPPPAESVPPEGRV